MVALGFFFFFFFFFRGRCGDGGGGAIACVCVVWILEVLDVAEAVYVYLLCIGPYLGDLTNELPPNRYISEFVSTGPKSYSYRDDLGCTQIKFKGIAKTLVNVQRVNFEAMLRCIQHATILPPTTPPLVHAQNMVFRIDAFGKIQTQHQLKVFRMVYEKRFIGRQYITYPWGYRFVQVPGQMCSRE